LGIIASLASSLGMHEHRTKITEHLRGITAVQGSPESW
jgi:hypothetical protein